MINYTVHCIILSIILGSLLQVQSKPISLLQAIDSAKAHSYAVKNQTLVTEYKSALKGAGYTIQQGILAFDYGNINSAYNDNKISISQTYQFPTVYSKQKSLLIEEWNASVIDRDLTIAEITKAVSEIYHYIIILQEKERLLLEADSIYAEFIQKAQYRFEKGETNILEKASQEAERGTIQMQLQQVRTDSKLSMMHFQLLLNTTQHYEPDPESLLSREYPVKEYRVAMHPIMRKQQQKIQTAIAMKELEESRYLPDLHVGVSTQTIQGVGADNINYTTSRRFNAISIGIGIPHPFGAQSAIIDAAETSVKISEYEYQYQQKKHEAELTIAIERYNTILKTLEYMEQSQLPNMKSIREAASRQFTAGEINYLEWALAHNQAMNIRNNYLQTLQAYYEVVHTITFLQAQ